MTETIVQVLQVVIALSLIYVWLVRAGRPTKYRGGDAKNIREEFAVYGLPYWFMIAVGTLKVTFAVLLVAGLWFPVLTKISAGAIAILMAGAVSMHARVKDPFIRYVPSVTLLLMTVAVLVLPTIFG